MTDPDFQTVFMWAVGLVNAGIGGAMVHLFKRQNEMERMSMDLSAKSADVAKKDDDKIWEELREIRNKIDSHITRSEDKHHQVMEVLNKTIIAVGSR